MKNNKIYVLYYCDMYGVPIVAGLFENLLETIDIGIAEWKKSIEKINFEMVEYDQIEKQTCEENQIPYDPHLYLAREYPSYYIEKFTPNHLVNIEDFFEHRERIIWSTGILCSDGTWRQVPLYFEIAS